MMETSIITDVDHSRGLGDGCESHDLGLVEGACSNCEKCAAVAKSKDERISYLSGQIESYQCRIKVLELELQSHQKQPNQGMEGKCQKTRDIRDQMDQRVPDLTTDLESTTDETGSLPITLDSSGKETQSLSDSLESFRTEVESLKTRLESSKNEAGSLTARLESFRIEIESLKLMLQRREEYTEQKEQECQKLKDELLIKELTIQDRNATIDDLRRALSVLEECETKNNIMDQVVLEPEAEGCIFQHIHSEMIDVPPDGLCQFCDGRKHETQDWHFHFNNCPESRRWHELNTYTSLRFDLGPQ